jgi:DNA modification methylase
MEINKIYNEDNILTMSNIPDNFIDGIITSPPYNMGRNPNHRRKDQEDFHLYEEDVDNLTTEQYLEKRLNEFKEFQRIIKPTGVICYNMSYAGDNPILPTLLLSKIHNETNLTLTDIIIWRKNSASPFQTSPNKLTRISELIYIIVNKNFLNTFKANKEVSTINEKTGQKFYKNYLNTIEAKNNDGFKSKLKATYSSELVEKLIHIYFPENSLIYDPFCGIATTPKGCINKKCNYIGSEKVKEFYEDGLKNIEETKILKWM